jgi:hypothetical protein
MAGKVLLFFHYLDVVVVKLTASILIKSDLDAILTGMISACFLFDFSN